MTGAKKMNNSTASLQKSMTGKAMVASFYGSVNFSAGQIGNSAKDRGVPLPTDECRGIII
jgi:hypothetical protein